MHKESAVEPAEKDSCVLFKIRVCDAEAGLWAEPGHQRSDKKGLSQLETAWLPPIQMRKFLKKKRKIQFFLQVAHTSYKTKSPVLQPTSPLLSASC